MSARRLRVVDSSVVVAAFASWHESHDAARDALWAKPLLVAHCALEAYSVLTRLPAPHRAEPTVVVEFLRESFRAQPLLLDAAHMARLPSDLQDAGITGGAVYDGLVAMTASAHRATLLTLDARAEGTYRRCGARYEMLGR